MEQGQDVDSKPQPVDNPTLGHKKDVRVEVSKGQ